MKIHHLNCGTLCPTGLGLLFKSQTKLVCHCLLIEKPDGLVLVDTGFGLQDCRNPTERLGSTYKLIGPVLSENETAAQQIQALGLSAGDVTDIIVTHLDFDHAGGISDFPNANVHVLQDEYDAASSDSFNLQNFQRYKKSQWKDHKKWTFHPSTGEDWLGFEAIRPMPRSKDQILMIPLSGHTKGHAGIAINTSMGWLLHAGDCFYSHASMNLENFRLPRALSTFEHFMAYDDQLRLRNVERLRELKRQMGANVDIFCAHDAYDLDRQPKVQTKV